MAPSNPPPQTIKSLKQDFLNAQTRLLTQPPAPSRAWRRAHDSNNVDAGEGNADSQKLSEKAIDDALFRLNHTLQRHAKRVYPPQATRHVAEQIEQLYLDAGEERMQAEREDAEGEAGAGFDAADWRFGSLGGGGWGNAWRMQGADYAQPEVISALPSTWDSPREAASNPLEAKRYADLVARLQGLSTRHSEAEARVRRLRQMKAVLEPFGSSNSKPRSSDERQQTYDVDNGKLIQQNLITRDGQVEKELERMRMLLARVGDKVARLQGKEGVQTASVEEVDVDAMLVDDVEVDERRKVDNLVSGLT